MSSGFDYFGNALPQSGSQQPAAGASPYAAVNTFAPPVSAPQYGYTPSPHAPNAYAPNHFGGPASSPAAPLQPVPSARSSRRPLIVVALVVIAGAVAAGVSLTHRAHPIALPSTLAGLPKANLHSAAAEIKSTKQKLSQSGIHDVSVGLYTDGGSSQALAVVAGHAASAPDFSQLASAMATTQIAGVSITPSVVTSGSDTFQCQTIAVAGRSVALCEWQSASTILFAVGQGLTTTDTAAALDDVIGQDQLH
jgi:hypothetical protein